MISRYLVLLLPLLVYSCGPNRKDDTVKATITDITESVYASVLVRPEDAYFPQPIRSGIIKEILVEEGDSVVAGQLLATISTTADIENQLTNAEISLQEARENYLGDNNLLLNMELEMETLRQQLTLDSLNYYRQKKLWDQQIGKKTELERYALAYESTQNQMEILQKKLAQTRISLNNQYRKAQSRLSAERSQLKDFSLRSELAGMVFAVFKEEGELIGPQEQLAEIGSVDEFVLEMDIDEEDIAKIEIGDTVAITLNAYANEVFTARVSRILPKKNETTLTFRVEGRFMERPRKLYNGLAGEANIIVDNRPQVMVIPSGYLLPGNKVLTREGERSIKTGVKNMNFVEVVSGIDTSTVLLMPDVQ